jgi:hypothetical protein
MNKLTIGIVYELVIENIAKELETFFADRQYRTKMLAKKRFPIADSMHPFLCALSENFDLAFVLILIVVILNPVRISYLSLPPKSTALITATQVRRPCLPNFGGL